MKFFRNNQASLESPIEIPSSDFGLPHSCFGVTRIPDIRKATRPTPPPAPKERQAPPKPEAIDPHDAEFQELLNSPNHNSSGTRGQGSRREIYDPPAAFEREDSNNFRQGSGPDQGRYSKRVKNDRYSSGEENEYDPEDQLRISSQRRQHHGSRPSHPDEEDQWDDLAAQALSKRPFDVQKFLQDAAKGKGKEKSSSKPPKKEEKKLSFKKIKPV